MDDPAEPIFEMDWIATQFILIFSLEKNSHVLTRVVATVYQKSFGNVTPF
ncbi:MULTISPECIES: replication protein [Lacticaseibacillus]|nr:replication protein [Lacticaseibacillus paracasei]WNX23460.1 replication protein [Lacticaseibacillus paracasei]